jgi:hypothetical protein
VFCCSYAVLFASLTSASQTATPNNTAAGAVAPPIVIAGFDAYKSKGPEDAVRTWIKGAGIDGSKEALSQSNNLRQIEDYYGKYQNFEVVKVQTISPKTQAVYVVMDYEKGPVFAKFMVYRTDQGWVLAYFTFNTKEELVFPQGQ